MAEQTHTDSFVPSGVDAGTWMGFERRIRRRRFTALIETFEQALRDGDRPAAQRALDEARELQPDAPSVRAAAERLTLLDAPIDAAPGFLWPRIFGAVALLLIGVSLLIGLDWLRSAPAIPVAPPAASIAMPPLGSLNVPVTARPAAAKATPGPRVTRASARAAAPPARAASPTRLRKVLKLFGVEVVDAKTTSVKLRQTI